MEIALDTIETQGQINQHQRNQMLTRNKSKCPRCKKKRLKFLLSSQIDVIQLMSAEVTQVNTEGH